MEIERVDLGTLTTRGTHRSPGRGITGGTVCALHDCCNIAITLIDPRSADSLDWVNVSCSELPGSADRREARKTLEHAPRTAPVFQPRRLYRPIKALDLVCGASRSRLPPHKAPPVCPARAQRPASAAVRSHVPCRSPHNSHQHRQKETGHWASASGDPH